MLLTIAAVVAVTLLFGRDGHLLLPLSLSEMPQGLTVLVIAVAVFGVVTVTRCLISGKQ
jgi:hypothetical protein